MAIVHCWYGGMHHPDVPDLDDGFVRICFAAIGVEEMPAEDLEPYHHSVPLHPCSCGYDPRPPAPEPVADGY